VINVVAVPGGSNRLDEFLALLPDLFKGFERGLTRGHPPLFTCASCGYDLTGITSATCPECGQIIENNPAESD